MKNQRGLITVDFLFSMVLVLGLSGLLFVLTFSLSIASVTQYITFAAARNYAASNINQATQTERANQKYRELTAHPVMKPLYTNGWYTVDELPGVGDHTQIIPEFAQAAQGPNKFWGVGTNFTARVLAFQIPGFGSTAIEGDESGEGFKTYLGSYLGREPTMEECLAFTADRWRAIRALPASGGASFSTGTGAAGYYPMADNGC